jgi:CheY-like chemotaxis protein
MLSREPHHARQILLAEPHSATAEHCRKVLEADGYVVASVDTGIAALVAARTRLPDVIFMGFQLRDVASREAIRWMRAIPALRLTPIIVLTGSAAEEATLATHAPDAALRKPLSGGAIRRAAADALQPRNAGTWASAVAEAPPAKLEDGVLRDCIMAELEKQSWASRHGVDVTVHDGVAELWGSIFDERERQAFRIVAAKIPGIAAVKDHLSPLELIASRLVDAPDGPGRKLRHR